MPMGEMFDGSPRGDAGDVHDDVHRPMTGVDVGGEVGHLVVVGDIERAMLGDFGTGTAGVGNRLGESLSVDVGQIQHRPVGGQSQGGGPTDTTGRTGDENPLAREAVCHG